MRVFTLVFRFAPGLFLFRLPSGNLMTVHEPSDSFIKLAARFGDQLGWDQ